MNSRIFSNTILIFVFSVLLNNFLFGQVYDVVVILNDKSTIKGELLELTPDSVAVIEEETGEYLVLQGSEISTVYIKGLNESIKYPISEVPDIFKKGTKDKSAVPYKPGVVYDTPGESYKPPTRPNLYSIGVSYGGISGKSKEAIDGFKESEFVGKTVISGSFLVTFRNGSAGIGVESFSMDLEETGANFGTLNLIPILFLLQWNKIPYGAGLGFHAGMGGGIGISSFDNGQYITYLEQQFGVNYSVETSIAFVFEFKGGIQYFFSENISISIDGRLILGSVSTDWTVSACSQSEQIPDFDSFSIGNFQYLAGLRAWFN